MRSYMLRLFMMASLTDDAECWWMRSAERAHRM